MRAAMNSIMDATLTKKRKEFPVPCSDFAYGGRLRGFQICLRCGHPLVEHEVTKN